MCNPPFADRNWGLEKLADDPRWVYGVPPRLESELAWVQHALAHVVPGGSVVMLMPPAAAPRARPDGEYAPGLLRAGRYGPSSPCRPSSPRTTPSPCRSGCSPTRSTTARTPMSSSWTHPGSRLVRGGVAERRGRSRHGTRSGHGDSRLGSVQRQSRAASPPPATSPSRFPSWTSSTRTSTSLPAATCGRPSQLRSPGQPGQPARTPGKHARRTRPPPAGTTQARRPRRRGPSASITRRTRPERCDLHPPGNAASAEDAERACPASVSRDASSPARTSRARFRRQVPERSSSDEVRNPTIREGDVLVPTDRPPAHRAGGRRAGT